MEIATQIRQIQKKITTRSIRYAQNRRADHAFRQALQLIGPLRR